MKKFKKRDRSMNFSFHETEFLIGLVEAKKHILESKKSDAATWHFKESAWKVIEVDYNNDPVAASVYREAKHLKSKYEAMKRDLRKKLLSNKDGGNMPHLTSQEKRIRELILFSDKGEEIPTDPKPSNEEIQHTIKPDLDLFESDHEAIHEEAESLDKVSDLLERPHSHCLEESLDKNNKSAPVIQTNSWVMPPSTSNSDERNNSVKITEWEEWRRLKTGKLSAMTRPLKRPYEKSSTEKPEEETTQQMILEENLENKKLQNTMLRQELKHKNEIHELEKQQMQIKIEILKMELHNMRHKTQ